MKNKATRYVADYIAKNQLSIADISNYLHIAPSKLIPGTKEFLEADDFLRLCCYLQIQPETILMEVDWNRP